MALLILSNLGDIFDVNAEKGEEKYVKYYLEVKTVSLKVGYMGHLYNNRTTL